MKLEDIDKNFKLDTVKEEDIVWYDIENAPFSIHGVFYDEKEEQYLRLPRAVADSINDGVRVLNHNTAGGRVRFITDSPYTALRAVVQKGWAMPHMPASGSHGFTLYVDGKFQKAYFPPIEQNESEDIAFEGIAYLHSYALCNADIYFPLYNGARKVFIGLKKGCSLQPPKAYRYAKPVLFYGSSITQGGCASRPGNDYISLLSRKFDFDYINLGFSGSARAEKEMVEYIASQEASVFVLDYDHNAPNPEHLRNTHLPLYEAIRAKHKDAPILMISHPDSDFFANSDERRDIVKNTYLTAKKRGDKKVAFVDGHTLFQKEDRDGCTVDGAHPNDLGFYRMAETIAPVLKKLLKKCK